MKYAKDSDFINSPEEGLILFRKQLINILVFGTITPVTMQPIFGVKLFNYDIPNIVKFPTEEHEKKHFRTILFTGARSSGRSVYNDILKKKNEIQDRLFKGKW